MHQRKRVATDQLSWVVAQQCPERRTEIRVASGIVEQADRIAGVIGDQLVVPVGSTNLLQQPGVLDRQAGIAGEEPQRFELLFGNRSLSQQVVHAYNSDRFVAGPSSYSGMLFHADHDRRYVGAKGGFIIVDKEKAIGPLNH